MEVRRILFPIEFHEASLRIMAVAGGIARRFNSEVVLLHVIAPQSYSPREWKNGRPLEDSDLLEAIVAFAENELHESIHASLQGLRLRCLVRHGDAASEIVAAAGDESVDLVVMPTHGFKGFYRHLIGSVTAEVMHDTDRPVLTASHLEAPAIEVNSELGVKHVLCGVTFSVHSREVLKCAARVATEFGAKLTIAHVTPSVELYGPGGNYVDRNWRDELVRSAQQLLSTIQCQTGITGDIAIDSGNPGLAFSRIAAASGADLLVVGCHNSGGHFGSDGYGIISEATIPVLSV